MFALSRRSFMPAGIVTVIGSVKAWAGSAPCSAARVTTWLPLAGTEYHTRAASSKKRHPKQLLTRWEISFGLG